MRRVMDRSQGNKKLLICMHNFSLPFKLVAHKQLRWDVCWVRPEAPGGTQSKAHTGRLTGGGLCTRALTQPRGRHHLRGSASRAQCICGKRKKLKMLMVCTYVVVNNGQKEGTII